MTSQEHEPTIAELFSLAGHTTLVTGGTGHLGTAFARALAEAGASVAVSSRDPDRAKQVAASLSCVGAARHIGVALDHHQPESIETAFDAVIAEFGQLDVLVNNAHEATPLDWTNIDEQAFGRQLGNLTGYFLLARRLRDHAVERQAPASVIMLGSMYSLVGSYPDAYRELSPASSVAYHALKGGVAQMCRHLAVYWAPDRVRVNCLSPGPFPGPQAPPKLTERLCSKSPLGRIGQPSELKGAVVFLASDASSYMTGQNLVIDGGWTAW